MTMENIYRIMMKNRKGFTTRLNEDEFQPALDEEKHIITDAQMDLLPNWENDNIVGFTIYMHFLMDGACDPGTITFKVKSTATYTVEKNIEKQLNKDLSKFCDSCKKWIENFLGVSETSMDGMYVGDGRNLFNNVEDVLFGH